MNRSLFRARAEPFGFVPASERGVEREVLAPLLQSRPAEPKTEQGIRHSRRVLGTAAIYGGEGGGAERGEQPQPSAEQESRCE